MRIIYFLILSIFISSSVLAADQTLLDQAEDTSPTSDDVVYVLDDPGGVPADKYVTLSNLIKAMNVANANDSADVLFETELDSEAELEAQLSDVTNVYTNNDGDLLGQEGVEDFAGALIADGTGTHTGIDITYQDSTGDVDFIVDLTEFSTLTFGAGSFTTLTFDAGASDPVITASSGALNVSTGTFSVGGSEVLVDTDIGSTVQSYDADLTDYADGTIANNMTVTGSWNFGGGVIEVTNGTDPTANEPCTDGEIFIDTDATSGQRVFACESGTFVKQGDGTGAGSGAFSDASDPVVLNTTTKDVVVGANQINTAKLSVDGDSDQVQFAIQGHSTQTSNVFEIENSAGDVVFSVDNTGSVGIGITATTPYVLLENQGEIRLEEATGNGGQYISFKAPGSLASTLNYVLFSADGSNGDVLSTNGSGTLSWATDDDVPESGDFGAAGDLNADGTITDGVIDKADLSVSTDFGDVSTDGSSNLMLDDDVVASAEMADADHGDVSWSLGVATVEAINGVAAVGADAGADAVFGWDDTAGQYENLIASEVLAIVAGVANDFDANGDVTITESDISDFGSYLPLSGGTMTGSLITDNLGIEFAESDTNPTCSAGDYHVYADLSETTLKKCVNGSVSDLDTTGSGSLGSNLSSTTDDILSDNGTILLGGTGGTNNETLDFDFETTANTVAISSATGVTTVDFGSIGVDADSSTVTLSTVSGAVDMGGATSFEIPNATSQTLDADGEFYLETDSDSLNIQAGSGTTGGIAANTDVAIPLIQQKDISIVEPDQIQTVSDAVKIFTVDSYNYPSGIKITAIRLTTDASSTCSYNIEEWASPTDGTPATIDAIATSASSEVTETTITDADVATGGYVYVDLDTCDVNLATITVWYYAKD